jgi:hypothetical protein
LAATDLARLRRLVDEPTEDAYSDTELVDRLSAALGDFNKAALGVWQEKLIAATSLVDVSEGGSSRRMSQAYDHAKDMVDFFTSQIATVTRPVLHKLSRTT